MEPGAQDIVEVAAHERAVLEEVVERVLSALRSCRSPDAFEEPKVAQATHGLDQGDALIYSAVLLDTRARGPEEPETFITRNSCDFDRQSIRDELEALDAD